ncbi:MAG: crotonase/enoyl-CoA hydratase family protein [SAR324 cluster bacterium]|nr:crotonase/enoyl-CoA hydratase family protein [SAR324 cluster bacterium]
MDYEQIQTEISDRIFTITLNRPERLNAFTSRMMEELLHALDQADADDDVRVIIFTGAGRAFCAGADLSGGPNTFNRAEIATGEETRRDGGGILTLRIFECKKPIIAAVNGPAVGVGVTMTLAMDIRLAADDARFGFVFPRRGIVPEACSSWFLPRVVGIGQALEWTFSGRVFGAQEALDGRLVRSLHPADELIHAARDLAREIADNTSAVTVALTRQMMWRMLGADHPMEAHKIDSQGVRAMGASADGREGVLSFLEKRPPRFTMRTSRDMPDYYPWWDERSFD